MIAAGRLIIIVIILHKSGGIRRQRIRHAPREGIRTALRIMGKTAFVLSMAKNIAVNFRNPVALFSLEMSNVQLVNRLISTVAVTTGG